MQDFNFIKDIELKNAIEDSVNFIVLLNSINQDSTDLFKEEKYRTLILYIVAIIEALLYYYLVFKNKKITYIEYKNINYIPYLKYKGLEDESVVIAIQKEKSKISSQIGLSDLLEFFKKEKLMKSETAEKISNLNNIRNTFHLSKKRKDLDLTKEMVEDGLELLVYVIENIAKLSRVY